MLVLRDVQSGCIFARTLPRKGFAHSQGVGVVIEDIVLLEHGRVILKSGKEPTLQSLQEEVRRRCAKSTIVENSGVGQPLSLRSAERSVVAAAEPLRGYAPLPPEPPQHWYPIFTPNLRTVSPNTTHNPHLLSCSVRTARPASEPSRGKSFHRKLGFGSSSGEGALQVALQAHADME